MFFFWEILLGWGGGGSSSITVITNPHKHSKTKQRRPTSETQLP